MSLTGRLYEVVPMNSREGRFVVIDKESGKILDDAQGYGYKSKSNAYRAYAWKLRTPEQIKKNKETLIKIKQWLKNNKWFLNSLEQFEFEIAKGSWGEDDKIDANFVRDFVNLYNMFISNFISINSCYNLCYCKNNFRNKLRYKILNRFK